MALLQMEIFAIMINIFGYRLNHLQLQLYWQNAQKITNIGIGMKEFGGLAGST